MTLAVGRAAFAKLIIIAVFVALVGTIALIGSRHNASASAFGPSPTHTGAPGEGSCTACHTSFELNAGPGTVQISGLPASYASGQQIELSVTATQQSAVIYGFQLTAIDGSGQGVGTFILPKQNPSQTQILDGIVGENQMRQYVEHTGDGLFTENVFGSNSWTFTWTAPSTLTGKIDFYVAGNAADGDGGTSGDYIYTSSKSTLPASSPSVSITGKVFTTAGLPLRNAKVTLTDQNNFQRFATTSSFGVYSFVNVHPGFNYTVNAQSKRYRFTPQILAVKDNLTDVDFTGLE